MKQVIDRILKEEESARAKLDNAKIKAEDTILDAKKRAQVLMEEAVVSTSSFAKTKKEEFGKQFLSEREKTIKKAKEEISAVRTAKEKDIQKFADKIFSKVISKGE